MRDRAALDARERPFARRFGVIRSEQPAPARVGEHIGERAAHLRGGDVELCFVDALAGELGADARPGRGETRCVVPRCETFARRIARASDARRHRCNAPSRAPSRMAAPRRRSQHHWPAGTPGIGMGTVHPRLTRAAAARCRGSGFRSLHWDAGGDNSIAPSAPIGARAPSPAGGGFHARVASSSVADGQRRSQMQPRFARACSRRRGGARARHDPRRSRDTE